MNINVDISNVVLKGERIVLRAFTENDLLDFYEYAKVDGVGEMAGWSHHESIETTKEILESFIVNKRVFAIYYNNKVIGSLGIEEYDEKELPQYDNLKGREIGYVLSKEYWGIGIMSEAVTIALDYLFNDLKVDFVVAGHFKENIRSKKVQDKFNFKYVKDTFYKTRYGVIKESVIRVLTKEDYFKKD